MCPASGAPAKRQLFIVGGDLHFPDPLRTEFVLETLQVGPDWQTADWGALRKPAPAWVVVVSDSDLMEGTASQLEEVCVHLGVLVRPERLIVVAPGRLWPRAIKLMRAGADMVLRPDAAVDEWREALLDKPYDRASLFGDPLRWLQPLAATAEILGGSPAPKERLGQVVRALARQLQVERVSIALFEDKRLRIAAAHGLDPRFLAEPIPLEREGITSWVVTHRQPRLVVGNLRTETGARTDSVQSAICAPLLAGDHLYGTINFSSLSEARVLGEAEFDVACVLARLVATALHNERLFRETQEKERLAVIGAAISSISHCFKNLVTITRGASGLLVASLEQGDLEQSRSNMDLLSRGLYRMEHLVLELLDFSKARKPSPERRDFVDWFTQFLESIRSTLPLEQRVFECRYSGEGTLWVDVPRLERALLNIFSNAIDATSPQTGAVLFDATFSPENATLQLSISDNGPGVAPENMQRLFQPFFSTKGSRGTGLGLAMVGKFAAENGGSAAANRCPVLGGLRIEIQLPVGEPPASEPSDS